MMYLFGLRDAEAAHMERMRRAQRRRAIAGKNVTDQFVRRRSEEADIIEVAFGRACDKHDRIGA